MSLRLGSRRLSEVESGWLQKKVKSKPEPQHKGTGWVRRLKKLWRRPLSQPGSYLCGNLKKMLNTFACFSASWLHCYGCWWTHFWVEQAAKLDVYSPLSSVLVSTSSPALYRTCLFALCAGGITVCSSEYQNHKNNQQSLTSPQGLWCLLKICLNVSQ